MTDKLTRLPNGELHPIHFETSKENLLVILREEEEKCRRQGDIAAGSMLRFLMAGDEEEASYQRLVAISCFWRADQMYELRKEVGEAKYDGVGNLVQHYTDITAHEGFYAWLDKFDEKQAARDLKDLWAARLLSPQGSIAPDATEVVKWRKMKEEDKNKRRFFWRRFGDRLMESHVRCITHETTCHPISYADYEKFTEVDHANCDAPTEEQKALVHRGEFIKPHLVVFSARALLGAEDVP